MSRPADIDLGLRIPVEGVQLIEASAGTGKTFTLATLHARLVIESGLPVTQVLAVTFTEAATKELRDRLRERLLLAARLAEGDAADERDESQRLTALLVAAALAREGAERLRGRLRAAAQAMDLAPIHTIHGFCRRVLAEHALEAGEVLGEVELLENERALREEVATDLWRAFSADAPTHALLRAQWPGPAALARDLRTLVAAERLLPAPVPGDAAAARRRLEAQCADLAAAFAMHGADARGALEAACAGRQLAGNRFRAEWIAPVWDALAAWAPLHPPEADFPEQFARFAQHELAARTAKGKATPASPLFAAIGRWCEARADFDDACEQARIALLHRLRDRARARLTELKRLRAQRGFDDLVGDVAAALAGETGPRLAAALRARWPVALVDEFQDTDPAQWSIFRRIYADAPPPADAGVSALFLIGDPKQAIYRFRGGDVHTYLAAAARADARHALERNFRSRPSVLATVEALFRAGGDEAFAQPGIAFASVAPGGRVADADALDDEAPAPALDVALLDAPEGALAAEAARAAAATACVAAVRALLEGGTRIREGATLRPVRPADIAVLVEKHADAVRIRARLAAAGVPCVAAGRDSLYASAEAAQMLCLLEALADVTDDSRLRALLATPWFGLDAAAIAALDAEAAVHRQWQDRVLDWRETLERRGILALVNALCAEAAPRLLRLVDGERRLSNLLQLAEALQEAQPTGTGVMALREALQRRIHEADPDNRTELLRLDSDAARVSIMTVHASKGLEFPFVFLPFVATGGAGRGGPTLAAVAHEDGLRTTTLRCGDAAWTRACAAEAAEERAESLRLLYVALTRARHATWLCWGAVNNVQHTALAWLLHRDAAGGRSAPDAAVIATRLRALAAATPGMRVRPAVDAVPAGRLRLEAPPALPPPPVAHRALARDWWVYSFSQLAREADGGAGPAPLDTATRGAGDEPAEAVPDLRFSGARFGNVLHAALERVDFACWRQPDMVPPEQRAILAEALREGGYGGDEVLADGLRLLAELVAATLAAPLPEGARLADLPAAARRSEMEFHLSMAPVAIPDLIALLHAHDVLRGRRGFGLRARIEGLMTGFIDLVYRHDGRYYVLDYKSNRLRDYGAAALEAAMRESEYDLQALIYTLALHRYLRARLPDYAYARHMGGVRYLFCRGLDGSGRGVFATRFPEELVTALDALLVGGA